MVRTAMSLLLQRRNSVSFTKTPTKPLYFFTLINSFSTSSTATNTNTNTNATTTQNSSQELPKPSSLSARMNFVFDQIDAIQKQRSQSHEALQKIRAWREKSNLSTATEDPFQQQSKPSSGFDNYRGSSNELNQLEEGSIGDNDSGDSNEVMMMKKKGEVELVHPWPEWIELMERLVQQNYFDHRRRDEDKMVKNLGFELGGDDDDQSAAGCIDFSDYKVVQSAFVNFGKDRFDILRSLSRQDIQILVGYGCPSTDKKAVFSSKLLRKLVHLDEGDVCSSCSLRSSCERGYLLTNKEDEARTIDVMRVLLAFGFDPVKGSVTNMSVLKQKSVKTVVRKLLHEIVKLSAVPIDPNLPPPVIKRLPPKVKQPPPPPKKRVGRDDVEMKRGDWLCPKCDFMNFAKNTKCLQCEAKRPKRQLLPGEWECPGCNFLNYRRNMACFHCDAKRPPDEFTENTQQERQNGARSSLERTASRPEVSNAWNFDFDDDESDGADVAAFEYADPPRMDEEFPSDEQAHRGYFGGPQDDFNNVSREKFHGNLEMNKPGLGFDDFDDEDDVDSYELDTRNNTAERKSYANDFSEDEGFSETKYIRDNYRSNVQHPKNFSSKGRPSRHNDQKVSLSDSEDDDLGFGSGKELSVHPKWKSSHVADSRLRSKGRGPTNSSRKLSFGSDEELGFDSDDEDDFALKQRKGNKFGANRNEFQRRKSSGMKRDNFSDVESDDDVPRSRRNSFGRRKPEPGRRFQNSGRGDHNFEQDANVRLSGRFGDRRKNFNNGRDADFRGDRRKNLNNSQDEDFRPNGRFGDRKKFLKNDFDRPSQGSRANDRGFSGNDWQMKDRGQPLSNPRREQSRNPYSSRFGDNGMDIDDGGFRNRRRFNER